ncbi:MAG: MBL fold metallo-hydrolase [Ruminococcaceae bacterium]|nr:MBL fold metallo-hydrolase [Oscillospiraceae bacterium]
MTSLKRVSLLLLCLCLLIGCHREQPQALTVTVLDVGQSDCTLVVQGDAVLMIDAGTATQREAVRAALRTRRIKEIDCLLLTHPHEDHYGNARMLIENFTVKLLILSPVAVDDWGYQLVLQAAIERGVAICYAEAGDQFPLGSASLEVLAVCAEAEDVNDTSVIARLLYGNTAFLFTGDSEEEAEAYLLSTVLPEKLACDFLKAGHHGSDTSTGVALLQMANPTHVAISCGKYNDYGFPHAALLERLAAVGAAVYRTDQEGDLCYSSDGATVTFQGNGK